MGIVFMLQYQAEEIWYWMSRRLFVGVTGDIEKGQNGNNIIRRNLFRGR